MTNPEPHQETALMLLAAIDCDPKYNQQRSDDQPSAISLTFSEILVMAAAVEAERDAREKAMREALLNAANQFEFYRYQHMGKNPPDEAKAKTNADCRDACLAALTGAKP